MVTTSTHTRLSTHQRIQLIELAAAYCRHMFVVGDSLLDLTEDYTVDIASDSAGPIGMRLLGFLADDLGGRESDRRLMLSSLEWAMVVAGQLPAEQYLDWAQTKLEQLRRGQRTR